VLGMRRGQVSPADKLLKKPARRPGAEEKVSCPCLLSYYDKNVFSRGKNNFLLRCLIAEGININLKIFILCSSCKINTELTKKFSDKQAHKKPLTLLETDTIS